MVRGSTSALAGSQRKTRHIIGSRAARHFAAAVNVTPFSAKCPYLQVPYLRVKGRDRSRLSLFVMPGLMVPKAGCFRLGSSNAKQLGIAELLSIHVYLVKEEVVDGPGKPGHSDV